MVDIKLREMKPVRKLKKMLFLLNSLKDSSSSKLVPMAEMADSRLIASTAAFTLPGIRRNHEGVQ